MWTYWKDRRWSIRNDNKKEILQDSLLDPIILTIASSSDFSDDKDSEWRQYQKGFLKIVILVLFFSTVHLTYYNLFYHEL